jgi:hypothetical protein
MRHHVKDASLGKKSFLFSGVWAAKLLVDKDKKVNPMKPNMAWFFGLKNGVAMS